MKPVEMAKVRIISPSSRIRTVIETLYDMKILHITDFHKGEKEFFDIGRPFKEATVYSEQLIDVRTMISRLGISGMPRHLKNFKQSQGLFSNLNEKFKNIAVRVGKLKAEEDSLMEELKNPMLNLDITKDDIKEYKSLASFVGTVRSPIDEKLASTTKDYLLKQSKNKRQIIFALYVKRGLAEKIRPVLNEAGFVEHQLPMSKRAEIESSLSTIRNSIDVLEKELENFKKDNSGFLVDYEFALTQLNEKAEVPLRFASSKSTFVASGWIPAKTAGKLKKTLDEKTSEKVSVEFLEADNPPTALDNPKLANPFEFLLNMYSLPKYYEIDPTILMFLTFPLFFGFMLGDVGYGLVTLVLMLSLERILSKAIKPLLRVITIASLATIFFGLVFGEFFGHEFLEHPLLNRVHDINTMMMIAVAVGVVHLNFGFTLGLINELKHHSFIEAFFRKGAWITLQIGTAIFGIGYLQTNQSLQIVGGVSALASLLMIIKSEGLLRIVELPTILSNILSYIRLYAIGLASVSLAAVVNEMSFGFFAQGGVSMLVGIAILLMGHFINLLLGLLGPFLHSLRLHYVEFFQKFYEGGGYRYSPFGIVKTLGGR